MSESFKDNHTVLVRFLTVEGRMVTVVIIIHTIWSLFDKVLLWEIITSLVLYSEY